MVKPAPADLTQCRQQLGLRTIQVHALDLDTAETEAIGAALATAKLIVAQSIATADDLAAARAFLRLCLDSGIMPAAILLDARVPGQHGGTGQCLPWQLLEGCQLGLPLILAGGLTPDNVAEAIRIVRPYAVDVASGVESSPGRKDLEKMRRFIGNAREAAA
jgi:phosphoribosylanthranilate isomerase